MFKETRLMYQNIKEIFMERSEKISVIKKRTNSLSLTYQEKNDHSG